MILTNPLDWLLFVAQFLRSVRHAMQLTHALQTENHRQPFIATFWRQLTAKIAITCPGLDTFVVVQEVVSNPNWKRLIFNKPSNMKFWAATVSAALMAVPTSAFIYPSAVQRHATQLFVDPSELTEYMAKAHEDKLKAVKQAEEKKNAEIEVCVAC